jgi:hypothetical protein
LKYLPACLKTSSRAMFLGLGLGFFFFLISFILFNNFVALVAKLAGHHHPQEYIAKFGYGLHLRA